MRKRPDAPYRSGSCRGWRKIKTAPWREANKERRLCSNSVGLALNCHCSPAHPTYGTRSSDGGASQIMRSYFFATFCLALVSLSPPTNACNGTDCGRSPNQTATPLPAKDGGGAVSGGRNGGAISTAKTAAPLDDLLFDIDKFAGYDRFDTGHGANPSRLSCPKRKWAHRPKPCAQDGQRTIWVRVGDHPPAGLTTCGPQSCSARLWRLWKMPERPHGRTRTHRLAAAATG